MKRFARSEPAAGEAARLGGELRDARMALGLGIEDISASLRIRRVYIAALEEGRVRDLPAPAYALGFVRSYAGALGLDADDMVRRFRDSIGPNVARRTDLVFPEPVPERGVPAGAVMLVGAVLAVGAYVVWYNWSATGDRTVDAVPPLPPRIEQVLREPEPPPPAPQVEAAAPASQPAVAAPAAARPVASAPGPSAAPAVAPTAPPPRAEESRVLLRAKADSWIQLRDRQAGTVLLNRVLRAGETYAVPARDGLLLTTGNAGGLEILVDGQPTPGLGAAQAVRRDIPIDTERLKAGVPSTTTAARPAQ